jgi:hypothetical protein
MGARSSTVASSGLISQSPASSARSAQTLAVNSVIASVPDTGAAADDSGDKG